MGNDLALAVLSDSHPPLFSYFKQLFAQVTNPPIDPIREAIVMSVVDRRRLRAQPARRDARARAPARDGHADPAQRTSSRSCGRSTPRCSARARSTSRGRSPKARTAWTAALDRICAEADEALADGINVLILSDRAVGPERAPMPALLAVGGVHHHLVREGTRLQTGLVLESGEPREVHHFATLIGYGASAINPYLMFESLGELVARRQGARRRRRRDGREERRQGHRQGPAQDDLQDGDLDDPVLQRRADLRGGRPRERAGRALLHRHRVADRRHRARRAGARDARQARARLPARPRRTSCRSAASTPGGATASTTCGTRRRSRCSSTRSGTAASRPTRSTRRLVNDDAARRATLRGLLQFQRAARGRVAAARRGRAGQGDRQALLDRRDVARLARRARRTRRWRSR